MEPTGLVQRLLDVIELDIAPKTLAGVERGCKLFGAAILRKSDLALVLAETNNEIESPLWHGEVQAIRRYFELDPKTRPRASDCVFLATHEPCPLCLSAITWSGFDNFFYLFSHEDSRDSFSIPHDLRILKEVFGLSSGGYHAHNAYWHSYSLRRLVDLLDPTSQAQLQRRIEGLSARYEQLSKIYQAHKGQAGIPLD
jgi:tRNA(Arg) A34 adenosine deaminase TadA